MATDYDSNVANVYGALCDEGYWLARLADSGADEARLDSIKPGPGGGVEVVTTQVLMSTRLPGLVSQFHRGDLEIQREESWTPLIDGGANAVVAAKIFGAPVSVTGNAELSGSETAARLTFHADIGVQVPLVGGKLENFIGNQLIALLTSEQRFTIRWIAGDC